jgi:1,2-diacylglycerol 3-beta-galactosyltransferase
MSDQKKILILTSDAGFGHRSAAQAIAAALEETCGDRCDVEIINPLEDKRTPAILRKGQSDYDRIVREMPDLYKLGYQASDAAAPSTLIESALVVMLFDVLRDLVRRHQPEAIITTYPLYQAPLGAVYTITRRSIPLITVVTDMATVHRLWFHDAADRCLVSTPAVSDQALKAGLSPARVQITGIPVHPNIAREERSKDEIRHELGWRSNVKTVLAVGSKRVEHLEDVLRVLNHSGMELQLALVAGGNDELYEELNAMEWHTTAHLYNFVENMPTLMHAADCIICKAGGLILTEALACGLPMLLINVIEGQETGNAKHVIEGKAGDLAQDPVTALEVMYHWLDQDGTLLAERARNARRLGHPRAAYDVAEKAWAAAKRGPYIKESGRLVRLRPKLIDLLNRHNVKT